MYHVCQSVQKRVVVLGVILVLLAVSPVGIVATSVSDDVRHPEGTLKVDQRQLVPGVAIEISGEKFEEGGVLDLFLVGVAGRFVLRAVTADSVGSFVSSIDIPGDVPLGPYRIVAMASDGDEVASLNVEVLAAESQPADHDAGVADHEPGADIPGDERLVIDRPNSPLVKGGAILAIVLALGAGGMMLRRSRNQA